MQCKITKKIRCLYFIIENCIYLFVIINSKSEKMRQKFDDLIEFFLYNFMMDVPPHQCINLKKKTGKIYNYVVLLINLYF